MPHADRYTELLANFGAATPELVAKRRLLRRTDSKFILPQDGLIELLSELVDHYRILLANGHAAASYQTLYFDTADLRCFHDHRRGFRPRHKVRIRHYLDRKLSFLEVKTRQSDALTSKQRKARPFQLTSLTAEDLAFIGASCDLPGDALQAQLWTNFQRVTLLGIDTSERITIDTDLELINGNNTERLAGIAIVEVKQAPFCMGTPAMRTLQNIGHRPMSTSKYCTASVLLRDDLCINRLMPALRVIEELRA